MNTLAFARCDVTDTWSLHGLWPDFDNGSWPSYCYDTDCETAITDDIFKEMDQYYPPCWSDHRELMCHEWMKHGTCFYDNKLPLGLTVSPEDYFNDTLVLYLKYYADIPEDTDELNYYLNLT